MASRRIDSKPKESYSTVKYVQVEGLVSVPSAVLLDENQIIKIPNVPLIF